MDTPKRISRAVCSRFIHSLQMWTVLLFLPSLLVATILTAQQVYGQADPNFSCQTIEQISVDECEALKALYFATDGDNWTTKTGWLVSYDPCTWFGIDCVPTTIDGKIITNVVQIQLSENRLNGEIPPALQALSKLRVLNLGNQDSSQPSSNPGNLNQLTGEFPAWITTLNDLSFLGLHRTGIRVTTFPDLSGMPNFTRLHVEGMYLGHQWPGLLDKLPKTMTRLFLRNTGLKGTIPKELAGFTQLELLDLDKNYLEGEIPIELRSLEKLQEFELSYNQLSGLVPKETVCHPAMKQLNLGHNKFDTTTGDPCIDQINPGWRNTQTVPPTILIERPIQNLSAGFTIDITPITFTTQAGSYEVGCRESTAPPENGYPLITTNAGKERTTVTEKDLRPGTEYTCAVRTFTEPHTGQKSRLVSEWSSEFTHKPFINLLSLYAIAFDSNLHERREEILRSIEATTANDPEKVAVVLIDGASYTTTTVQTITGTKVITNPVDDTEIYYIYGNTRELVSRSIGSNGKQTGSLVGLPILDIPEYDYLSSDVVTESTRNLIATLSQRLKRGEFISASLDDKNELKEYNMANPLQLGAFIKWARATFESAEGNNGNGTKTTFTFIGHGVPLAPAGPASNMGSDKWFATGSTEPYTGTFPLPSKQDITPGDITDSRSTSLISPYALAEALRIGTDNGTKQLAVLDIVHCFGATIEELYELSNAGGKPFAEVIVGSPNYAYAGSLVMKQGLADIQPEQNSEMMGQMVIDAYDKALKIADISNDGVITEVDHPRVMVAVRSALIPPIKNHIDALALQLLSRITDTLPISSESLQLIDALQLAHSQSTNYDTTFCDIKERPQDWILDQEDALSDLNEFVSNLESELVKVLGNVQEITTPIGQIKRAIDEAVIKTISVGGKPHFAKVDVVWNFPDSISGIGLYTDFVGMNSGSTETITKTILGWQAYWYVTDEEIPYAFSEGEHTWSDLFTRYWETRMAVNKEQRGNSVIELFACDVDTPLLQYMRQLYLPIVQKN